jgi:cytosol alanyl aminopeptidase
VNRSFALVLIAAIEAASAFCQTTPPKLRLPGTIRPVHYSASLSVIPGEDRFTGLIEIEIQLSQPASTIWLFAKSLEFRHATILSGGVTFPVAIKPANNDFVAFTVPGTLNAGHVVLTISYTGELSRILTDGAFQQKQGDDWYVFTKFEPVTARRVFPCFDEPSYKTAWKLTLLVPEGLKAFSNTPIVSEEKEANGIKAVHFQETKPLPSYLIAFAAGPFDVVNTAAVGRNQRPSRIIVPRGRGSEAAYAVEITPKLIAMLEDYFGTPYPYEKLDQIVVPLTTAWGAMENAGLIAYGGFLLSPKPDDTELRRRSRASTMEHEMSHQWFGDLVTMSWWDDIWLNEAFASWLSTKLLDEWKPEWHMKTEAAKSLAVMRADSLTSARRIRQPIETPGDIGNAFDGITYGKGEAVIGMFENYVGPDKFQKAIRLYLQEHAWGNATSADLFAAIDNISGPGHGAAFSTFLNQTGFPIVNVQTECFKTCGGSPCVSGTFLKLAQQHFLATGSDGPINSIWNVPVCFVWNDDAGTHRQCVLLKEADGNAPVGFKSCPTWLFADANAAGYYAVSYKPPAAEALFRKALPYLTAEEGASALRNVQLLFSSGVGDARQELDFVAQFSRSSDPGLVRQAAATIAGLNDAIPEDLRGNYAQLIRSLYGERARELGWKPHTDESLQDRQLRMDIVPLVATRGEESELQSKAAALAREWLKDRHSLDPDMVIPVLSTAAWNGDRELFDELVDAIKKDKIQRERAWMIAALCSFRDPAIARSALDLIFGGGIDARELQGLVQNPLQENRETVWAFVQQNFERLNSSLPSARGIPFGAMLPLSAVGFCDTRHRTEVETFFKNRLSSVSGGARNLANTLERIHLCSTRADVVQPAIVDLLKSYHQTRDGHSDAFRLSSH